MKPRLVLLLGVAVVGGLAAAFLASQATGAKTADNVAVPVAIKPIKPGQYLGDSPEAFFIMADKPRATVTPNTITDIKELKGKVVQQSIDQDAMVSKAALVDSGGLTSGLAPGQRAITIRVNIDSAVAGFVIPTSHVDLLCFVPDPKDPRQVSARTFLQNIKVLAVNTEDIKAPDARVMVQPATVTLAVNLADAEKVMRAVKEGVPPTLVLRKPGDETIEKTTGAVSPFEARSEGENTKKVWLAKLSIEPNTTITRIEDFFDEVSQPASTVPADAITDKAVVQGKKVERYIGAKAPLTRAYFVKPGDVVEIKTPPPPSRPHELTIYNGAVATTQPFDAKDLPVRSSKEPGSEGK